MTTRHLLFTPLGALAVCAVVASVTGCPESATSADTSSSDAVSDSGMDADGVDVIQNDADSSDEGDVSDAGEVSDTEDDTPLQCTGSNPGCWECGLDAPVFQAECVAGQWDCAGALTAEEHADCPVGDCGQYAGEICCAADGGTAPIPALCPSPAEAYCEDASTPQFQCPVASGACHDGDDCTAGESCVGPGDPPSCGICMDPDPSEVCTGDGDCADAQVCELTTGCFCSGPAMLCQPACTADSCDVGQACENGHCVPAECGTPDDACPPLFICNTNGGGPSGVCERRTCTDDSGCQVGWCVNGSCWPQPGACQVPPP